MEAPRASSLSFSRDLEISRAWGNSTCTTYTIHHLTSLKVHIESAERLKSSSWTRGTISAVFEYKTCRKVSKPFVTQNIGIKLFRGSTRLASLVFLDDELFGTNFGLELELVHSFKGLLSSHDDISTRNLSFSLGV